MGAWGYGLFESDHDADTVSDLNYEAGLPELEKAAGQEEFCYTIRTQIKGGGEDPEKVRKHLDSGVLEKLFAKKEAEMLKPSKNAWMPDYTFVLLGACAITLGCRIPAHYKRQLQKHFLHADLMEAAERQMFKALNGPGGYQEGVPYPFEVPADVVAAHEAEMKAREAKAKATGGFVMMNVPAPGGLFAGPPKNKALRATMEDGKYGTDACGGCGAEKKDDGGALLRCAKCKTRGYCNIECQKEHWKLHKKVCVAAAPEAGKEIAAPQAMYAAGRGA